MNHLIGRTRNESNVASVQSYTINSTSATTIAIAKKDRMHFSVCLDPGTTNVDVYIRLYPAVTDNIKMGEVLTRDTFGNSNLFRSSLAFTGDSVYTGEISAISLVGSVVIHVTEY